MWGACWLPDGHPSECLQEQRCIQVRPGELNRIEGHYLEQTAAVPLRAAVAEAPIAAESRLDRHRLGCRQLSYPETRG